MIGIVRVVAACDVWQDKRANVNSKSFLLPSIDSGAEASKAELHEGDHQNRLF